MSARLAAAGDGEEIEVLEDERPVRGGPSGGRARGSIATLLVFVTGAAVGAAGSLSWAEWSRSRMADADVAVEATFAGAAPAPQDGTPAGYLPGRIAAVVELHNTSPGPVRVDRVEVLPLPGIAYGAAGAAAVADLAPNDRTTVPVDMQIDCASPATRLPDVRLAITPAGGPQRTLVVPVERTAESFGGTVSSTCGPPPGQTELAIDAETTSLARTGKRSGVLDIRVHAHSARPESTRITDISLRRPGVRVSLPRVPDTLGTGAPVDLRLRLVVEHCGAALAAGAETELRIRVSDGVSSAESGPDGGNLELELLEFIIASCG